MNRALIIVVIPQMNDRSNQEQFPNKIKLYVIEF